MVVLGKEEYLQPLSKHQDLIKSAVGLHKNSYKMNTAVARP